MAVDLLGSIIAALSADKDATDNDMPEVAGLVAQAGRLRLFELALCALWQWSDPTGRLQSEPVLQARDDMPRLCCAVEVP